MGKIVILDEITANKIAAGEVVERPASVVKEMVENSIDAEATNITVDIRDGGITKIKITDNGSGIAPDDAEIAFERHSTSKIRSAFDLDNISTLGFRGEALASIASVSKVELISREKNQEQGMCVKVEGGRLEEVRPIGCPIGTTFIIKDLFYNTPARYKFLKKDTTEASYILDIINRIALARPDISFKFINKGKIVLHTPGNGDLKSTIFSIYGRDVANKILPVCYQDNNIKINGFIGKPEIARGTRNQQSLYLNKRYIKSKLALKAIEEAYKTFLMKGKFPFYVLNMEINPMFVDINVHPTKMEVRFSNEQDVFRGVYSAVNNTLLNKSEYRVGQMPKNVAKTYNSVGNASKPISEAKVEGEQTSTELYAKQRMYTDSHREFVPVEHLESGAYTSKRVLTDGPRYVQSTFIKSSFQNEKEHEIGTLKINQDEILIEKMIRENMEKSRLDFEEMVQKPVYQSEEKQQEKPRMDVPEKECEPEEIARVESVDGVEKSEEETKLVQKQENEEPVIQRQEEQERKVLGQETIQEKAQVNNNLLIDCIVIGQLFRTYILLQKDNEFYIIDQHAAHERIMFEKLKKKYNANENMSQELVVPVLVEMQSQEIKEILNNKDKLLTLGFTIDEFGNNTIIIRGVPAFGDEDNIKQYFLDTVDSLIFKNKEDDDTIDETLHNIACKSAIKAHKRMDNKEIYELLKELDKLENPFTCPHGRPTALRFTKYEIEKMFKRIV